MAPRNRSKKFIREDTDRINFCQIQVTASNRHLPWEEDYQNDKPAK
jgi:hypothetical protein